MLNILDQHLEQHKLRLHESEIKSEVNHIFQQLHTIFIICN